jgi:hypothetical protein
MTGRGDTEGMSRQREGWITRRGWEMTGRPPGAMEGCSKEEGGITEGRRGQGMEGVGITRPSDPLITLMTVERGDHRVGRPLLVEPDLLETHIVTYSPRQEGEVLITVQGQHGIRLNRRTNETTGMHFCLYFWCVQFYVTNVPVENRVRK